MVLIEIIILETVLSVDILNIGLFIELYGTMFCCLEHYVKQQLFQSLPLHTGPSLNCPGETAELWQSELSWPLVRT